MSSLLQELSAMVGSAFAAEGFDSTFGLVQPSDRPDLSQFQCNGALPAAKASRTKPRVIAEKIAARLRPQAILGKVEIAGAGFINLDVTDDALVERMASLAKGASVKPPPNAKTAVIDFGGPNVAKAMHVGHLRSAIIGDCLQRLFRTNGWTITSDVHLGDWGLQMGQLISEIARRKLAPVYFDLTWVGPYPDTSPVSMEDLEEMYPAAAAACRESPERLQEARQATAELQAGRRGYVALWKQFVRISEAGLRREYAALGISFDLWKGESDAAPLVAPMIDDLRRRNLAYVSDGALVMNVARNTDRKEIPPLILVKQDGAVTYGTTDLATIIDRVARLDPELILYVVDQRQNLHLEQVFRAAELANLNGRARLEHVGFGTMNGTDGKPFRTRSGDTVKLFDLIRSATAEAEQRLKEQGLDSAYPAGESAEIARKVGVATIKFADLSNHRSTDYVFDLARFSRFEGKTGPYLQYTVVRISSILRKAEADGMPVAGPTIRSDEERKLSVRLLAMPDIFAAAEEKRAPNLLCDFAFALSQEFARFYNVHHILSEQDATLRASRLGLCKLAMTVLTDVLDVLGVEVPARM
ncbi:MAG: arginine--tRNA ligase [Alphaproteobacteria bacterium]|nr:arginine--tRNA ligase [Alphaproteobacteria bacterium]